MHSLRESAPPSPPETIDLAQVRELLASQYGIIVSSDDPILAAVALNEIVLDAHLARIDAALQRHTAKLAETDRLRQEQQQALAKKVLGEALHTARASLRHETAEAITALRKAIREPILQERESRWKFLASFLGLVALIGWSTLLLMFFNP